MPRTILAVYAHPDDETSSAGALMAMYRAQGVAVHVITATRGELGSLGTGGIVIEREDLPKVREAEIRSVLAHYGLPDGPLFLDYRDQELKLADFEEVVGKILAEMERVRPDVVLTFGPHGISGHDDHVALHEQTVAAFDRYRAADGVEARLLYTAIPKVEADHFNLHIDGPESQPNVVVDVADHWHYKVEGLRLYRSQLDAQEFAQTLEDRAWNTEVFHQAYPPLPEGTVMRGLFGEG